MIFTYVSKRKTDKNTQNIDCQACAQTLSFSLGLRQGWLGKHNQLTPINTSLWNDFHICEQEKKARKMSNGRQPKQPTLKRRLPRKVEFFYLSRRGQESTKKLTPFNPSIRNNLLIQVWIILQQIRNPGL